MKSIITKFMTTKSITKKRRMVANLLGIIVGIALTAAIGGGLWLTSSDILDSASSIASIEIQGLRLFVTGDETYLSMNVKNTGTEAATDLYVRALLECNANNGVAAAGVVANTSLDPPQPALDDDWDCSTNQAKATPSETVKPGSLQSYIIGAKISELTPGETSSVSGAVKVYAATGGTTAGFAVKLVSGDEYLIQIDGKNADGEPIAQTATTRVR